MDSSNQGANLNQQYVLSDFNVQARKLAFVHWTMCAAWPESTCLACDLTRLF